MWKLSIFYHNGNVYSQCFDQKMGFCYEKRCWTELNWGTFGTWLNIKWLIFSGIFNTLYNFFCCLRLLLKIFILKTSSNWENFQNFPKKKHNLENIDSPGRHQNRKMVFYLELSIFENPNLNLYFFNLILRNKKRKKEGVQLNT